MPVEPLATLSGCESAYRIFIIESEILLAKALCSIFAQDNEIEVLGDNRTFDSAALVQANPDLVLIDCDCDLIGTRETIAQCRAAVPTARVCILSSQLRPEIMVRALSAGADGYVVKDITPAELLASLKRIRMEGFYADPRLASYLLKNRDRNHVVELSARELDVARLIAQGLSNRDISCRLMLSDKTVKNHISNIFSKLNVTARTQVAIYVLRNGLA